MGEKTNKVSGRVKEAAGDLTNNQHLKNEGKADRATGKAKEIVDDTKDKAEDAIDAVKDKLHRS